jgi:ribonuclease P protein component
MLILSIKSRQDFVNIQKKRDCVCHTLRLILLTKKTPEKYTQVSEKKRAKEFIRFGLTVTKKLEKTAVGRNRIKRRIREAFRKIPEELLQNHTDYQIIARKRIIDCNFQDIVKDIKDCLEKKTRSGFPERRVKKKNSKNKS